MTKAIYKIFDLLDDRYIGLFCLIFGFIILFISVTINDNKPIKDYNDFLMFILPAFIPSLFFIVWFILAILVFCVKTFIVAPIEFVVYELGIPKIKINVDVIWKYQQKD